jgi:hypothetical protein
MLNYAMLHERTPRGRGFDVAAREIVKFEYRRSADVSVMIILRDYFLSLVCTKL